MIAIIGFISVLVTIHKFNQHCDDKFAHKLFTMRILTTLGVGAGLFLWGQYWYTVSLEVNDSGYTFAKVVFNEETRKGLSLIALAIIIYLTVAISNFTRTNWAYGIFGTGIQLGFLYFIGYFGLMVLGVYLMASIFALQSRYD